MRRVAILAVFVTVVACLCAPPVQARGLYKGSGRITARPLYNPFSVRLNGAVGWHGAYRAKTEDYYDQPGTGGSVSYGWGDWKFGYYGSAGLEFNLGGGVSLEPYGLYRTIEQTDNYRAIITPTGSALYQSVDSKVYGAGANLRFYKNWDGGAAYMGLGGGYAHGEATWELEGNLSGPVYTEQDSGDFHLMAGLDLHLSMLSVGFELGWRWSGLDSFNEFEGAFLGARAGIMFGPGD